MIIGIAKNEAYLGTNSTNYSLSYLNQAVICKNNRSNIGALIAIFTKKHV